MLAGLLFAIHDAEDRPEGLTATLPFAGTTLIEYQARLLAAAGASQIVVVVAKLAPDLLGALSRIGRRGVVLDAVRTAAEAAEKLHPLSRVLVLAEGLVTTNDIVRQLGADSRDTLLVMDDAKAGPAFERIGQGLVWGGVSRLCHARMGEVAALPRDYDLQSALLRAASQAGAAHLLLPTVAIAEGHGIEHRAAALEARGQAILSSMMADAHGWFDRWVVAPIGRRALAPLATRRVSAGWVLAGGLTLAAGGLVAIWFNMFAIGLVLALAGIVAWAVGEKLAALRDESRLAKAQVAAALILPALAVVLVGWRVSLAAGQTTALVTAIALVIAAGLAERTVSVQERLAAWGSPGAYLLVILLGALGGVPLAGLAMAAMYAAITLGLGIEVLRRRA